MRWIGALAATVLWVGPALAESSTKVVVPAVTVSPGVEPEVGTVVAELILEALLNRHGVRALGPQDVKDLLNAEQQKLLLGCDKDSCMAELAGALGAGKLVAGLVARVGSLYVLTLKLVDPQTASVIARSSKSFPKVEDVPAAIGPAVDELLQATPRARPTAVALEPKAEKARPPAMEVGPFCKRAKAYAEELERGRWQPATVGERRALLEDLLFTAFLKEYKEKQLCLRTHDGRVSNRLANAVRAARSADEAQVRRQAFTEWRELNRQLDLLEEAYQTGYEKEKNGSGARPLALPFVVAAKEVEGPEDSPELRRFLDDFESGQVVVRALLAAVAAQDRAAFDRLFTANPRRSAGALDGHWASLGAHQKNGYEVEVCPIFSLAAPEVERGAQRLAKDGVLYGCVRRTKGELTLQERVELVQSGGRWQVERL